MYLICFNSLKNSLAGEYGILREVEEGGGDKGWASQGWGQGLERRVGYSRGQLIHSVGFKGPKIQSVKNLVKIKLG